MKPLGPIRFLTVHCSGSPARRGDDAHDVMAWDIERFGQPSYHWIIDESGNKSRCLSDSEKGAHVGGHNTGNIGICYIGGLDPKTKKPADTRTPLQVKALHEIIAMYETAFPDIVIRGHRDWPNVRKACPCFDVASELHK